MTERRRKLLPLVLTVVAGGLPLAIASARPSGEGRLSDGKFAQQWSPFGTVTDVGWVRETRRGCANPARHTPLCLHSAGAGGSRYRVIRAHRYRGFTTQRFTPSFQIQPQVVVETSGSGRSISMIGFVVECPFLKRSATVFAYGISIARKSGSFQGRVPALLNFVEGAAEPGQIAFRGEFVGGRAIHGVLAVESPSCHVSRTSWAAYR